MNYQQDTAEYRSGAVVVGAETEAQERLEVAKLAPGLRHVSGGGAGVAQVQKEARAAVAPVARALIETPQEALTMWAEWCVATGDTAFGPKGLDRPSPKMGDTQDQQVVILVETTPGFNVAFIGLRAIYQGIGRPVRADRVVVRRFERKLTKRLPFRPLPRRGPDCIMDEDRAEVPKHRKDRLVMGMSHDLRPPGETAS